MGNFDPFCLGPLLEQRVKDLFDTLTTIRKFDNQSEETENIPPLQDHRQRL